MRVSFPLSLSEAVNSICLQVAGEWSFSLNHCLSATGCFLYHWLYAKEPQVLCRCIFSIIYIILYKCFIVKVTRLA